MSGLKVSVVVSTRDRAERLEELLGSLRTQTLARGEWEVVVVDNGSLDDTPKVLERFRDDGSLDLRIVTRKRGEGRGPGRNAGWREAKGALIAFTDDDCEADPAWLEAGLAAAAGNPRSFIQGRTEPIPREVPLIGPYSRTIRVEAESPFYETCNMFYPRALLEELGGFEDLAAGEDTDLAWRALESGWSSAWAGDARVFHAVIERGAMGMIRLAFSWSDGMYLLRRHPSIRQAAMNGGIFWKTSHRLLLMALAGVAIGRFFPPTLILAVPYARQLRQRCAAGGIALTHAPFLALCDCAEVLAAVRGGVRHGTLVV